MDIKSLKIFSFFKDGSVSAIFVSIFSNPILYMLESSKTKRKNSKISIGCAAFGNDNDMG